MAHAVISHPFRLLPSGGIGTVLQGSDEQLTEAIAALVLTGPGERELEPTFGLADPTFDRFDAAGLQAAVDAFGPDVTIRSVDAVFVNERTEAVTVTFTTAARTGA